MIDAFRSRSAIVIGWMVGTPHATASLGLLRSVIGLVSVALYVVHYRHRSLFFGPDGAYGLDGVRDYTSASGTWSVYALSASPVFFEIVFHVGLVVAVLVMLGVGGRVLLALHYVTLWSLYMVNPAFMDGGDALAATGLLFLLMTRCSSTFTVVRKRERRAPHPSTIALHNTGLLLLVTQVVIVYLMAGLYKVQGELWQDGTALYYILNVPEFFLPSVTPLVVRFGWLLVLAAYATVLTSVFFPVLVIFRSGRPVAVSMMLVFHLAVAVLMGLTSFAMVMAAYDLLFVDGHVRRVQARIRRVWSAIAALVRTMRRGSASHARSA